MSTTNFARSHIGLYGITFGGSDFDLTAANQTAQNLVFTLPANKQVIGVTIRKGATATTSSATLTALNVTIGTAAAGTQYLSSTDIKGASANLRGTPTQAASASESLVYVTATPAGTGGNWDTLTFGSDVTVTLQTIDVDGEVL